MKLNSITCLPEAKCVAVECDVAPGPPQEHAVLGAQWLHSTADILYQQDKVCVCVVLRFWCLSCAWVECKVRD